MSDRPYGSARSSAARRDIAAAVEALSGSFTVGDIAEECRRRGTAVALATVYRAAAALESAGTIERLGERGGAALWARCAESGHHHHLVCTGCGRTAHLSCPLDEALVSEAADKGYVITRHQVEVYGLCRECLSHGIEG